MQRGDGEGAVAAGKGNVLSGAAAEAGTMRVHAVAAVAGTVKAG